jgi:hypothetical protein
VGLGEIACAAMAEVHGRTYTQGLLVELNMVRTHIARSDCCASCAATECSQ